MPQPDHVFPPHDDTWAWVRETYERAGIDPVKGTIWLAAHYEDTHAPIIGVAIDKYVASRLRKGTGAKSIRQMRASLKSLAEHREPVTTRENDTMDMVTTSDVEAWLAQWNDAGAKTRNERLAHIHGWMLWARKQGWMIRIPTDRIEREPLPTRGIPRVLPPTRVAEIMAYVERYWPEYAAYYALSVFAGIRPDVREGEASRLHADLVAGVAVQLPAGLVVRGKTGEIRVVRYAECGPLKAWLDAYPIGQGLFPRGLSLTQVDRQLARIRREQGLSHDVMRHTAATTMLTRPGSSYAVVAQSLGNSEQMLRKHYMGIYSAEDVAAIDRIMPAR